MPVPSPERNLALATFAVSGAPVLGAGESVATSGPSPLELGLCEVHVQVHPSMDFAEPIDVIGPFLEAESEREDLPTERVDLTCTEANVWVGRLKPTQLRVGQRVRVRFLAPLPDGAAACARVVGTPLDLPAEFETALANDRAAGFPL